MRAAAAVLLLALLAGCGGETPAPAPSPPAGTGWPIGVDSEAIGLAAAPDGLIVVSAASSRHPPQVQRFDATGRPVARPAAVGNPNTLALDPEGAAWMPAVRHPDMVSGTGVPVLDPVSLRPRREIDAGGEPLSVAFVGTDAWIGMRGRIAVIDRRTGQVRRTLPIAGTAYDLVAAGATVAVLLDRALLALDARTGRRVASRDLDDAGGSLGGALAAGALWVSYLDDDGQARLRRLDPRTLAPLGEGPVFGNRDVALAGGDVLWVADHEKGTLTCLDPANGRVRSTVRVPNTSALAVDGQWAYLADSGKVNRVAARC